jgi:hypothetical protein
VNAPRGAFEPILTGGDRRSLGRVDEVIEAVLARPSSFAALFDCLFSADEIVRMRAGDAIEKVARRRPDLLEPYHERLLVDVAAIEQASVQWHLAQILPRLELGPSERRRAIVVLKRNNRQRLLREVGKLPDDCDVRIELTAENGATAKAKFSLLYESIAEFVDHGD